MRGKQLPVEQNQLVQHTLLAYGKPQEISGQEDRMSAHTGDR